MANRRCIVDVVTDNGASLSTVDERRFREGQERVREKSRGAQMKIMRSSKEAQ